MSGERRRAQELEVRLLGPTEVLRGGRPVALGAAKPMQLLAVLALEVGRVVSVDLLLESLWPGEAPPTATHAVQVYVSQLRKSLGASVVPRRGAGYVLELEPAQLDVHRFVGLVVDGREALSGGDAVTAASRLREALALWRGPALADFMYEPFAQAEIARLEELRLEALEARIDADLELGRHADLVPELEAFATAHPLREHPRGQLMLALYRSGRQADALAAYRETRERLVDELGIEPGRELRALETAVLRQDDSLLLPETAPALPAMQFRRLATILFVDVVDAIVLGEALDAEVLATVQRRYFEVVSAAVTRHSGRIERYAGDAVMAAFGVPVSHEDDALRAARAALDIRVGIGALNEQLARELEIQLEVRIGISAGEVVTSSTPTGQRMIAGDPVGIAARLQHEARPGEIVVGEIAARLVDHAAHLELRGEIEIPGRGQPFRIFLLHEVVSSPVVYAGRLDAPFVGRRRELATLRAAAKRALAGSPQAVVVIGSPGIGKSRLAAEFIRRAKGVMALRGRCLSYGDGITYWPLRDILERAPASDERDAVVVALEAETPPPAPEIALLFRQFCAALASEKPLVLVVDDVHWADATLRELVESLVDRGEGRLLVVCLAREELDEGQPGFLAGRERIELDALSSSEAEVLLDELGATVLESDQRSRIAEAAEGNPFFVEQLLALAVEGRLGAAELPPTVQVVLAARLDRLGPGERAVLERGAVVGKEFTGADVAALLEPEAVPHAATHLEALVLRGFVRPHADDAFAFRHILVRDAVYRAAPKRLRAELHERFADRLDAVYSGLHDLDEFAGYHLEQAYRLRRELGESDRRTEALANAAGERLGAAGFRALQRGDMPASVTLLGRATALLPKADEARTELMCELGVARLALGDAAAASAIYADALAAARAEGHGRVELRAQVEAAYGRLLTEPEGAASNVIAVAESALPTFETLGDDRSLARTWLLIGYVRGGIHGDHAAWEEAEERALHYYRATAFAPATCVGQIAAAVYWGPTPVSSGITRCTELLEDETIGLFGRAAVSAYLGGLHAQIGRFGLARELVAEAEQIYHELGAENTAMTTCGTVRADIELLALDPVAAEATLREQCAFFERTHDRSHLAVRAAKLAESLYRQGRSAEAEQWVEVARSNAASDDQSAQLILGSVAAKLLVGRGLLVDARDVAEQTVRLAEGTDGLNQSAVARLALAEVLRASELHGEADRAIQDAIELFERKGNVVGASQARGLLELISA